MNTVARKCDGCGEYIALSNENNRGVFHKFIFNFKTHSSDNILSENKTTSIYCPRCFDCLNKHMNEFIEENGKQYTQLTQPEINGESQPLSDAAIASKQAKQNFKAVDGTILQEKENK